MKIVAAPLGVFLLMHGYCAPAQDYPSKPIRWIVPFAPGGGTDMVARMIGQKLGEAWSQPVIIDNRSGAGGSVGTEIASKSAPDGYTLLFGESSGHVIIPLLNSKLGYDPARDFAPISLLVINQQMLVVNSSVQVNSVKELIALAKASPGKLNFGSSGNGAANHLCMELFKSMAGVEMVHVPYKGAGSIIADLLGGQVQLMFNPIPPFLPYVKSGKLRALAVTGAQRSPAVPEIPTIAEAGVPGYEFVTWYGLFAPAHTAKDIVDKLHFQLVKVLADPELVQRLVSQGTEPRTSTPDGLAQFLREDTERVAKIIKSAGIKLE